ncbi:molybdate ABC transporter substrate-binding protein [Lyngbya aestuarii]|uniref:molybdate ABC transporter substrate-binding protein n=1 Tax=Lyngbya aestuarii TaxID=118322 RepID=UPI00403DC18C
MKRKQALTLIAWMFPALVVTVGCNQATTNTPSETSTAQSEPVELTVSAAASLQDAMKAIEPVYKQEKPNVTITYNFGSSGSLEQQIEQGAPVDVFLSAAPKWIDTLQQKDLLLEGTRQDLLKNSIVLITPKDKTNISDFQQLTTNQVNKVAIGEPESVPAGQYAKEVLVYFKLFDPLQSKFVFAKDVRQVLSYVETGNVDAGLVYGTDAKISGKVQIAATAPEDSHQPIIYPVAVIKDSKNPEPAQEFVQFLSTDTAKAVFEEYDFGMVE